MPTILPGEHHSGSGLGSQGSIPIRDGTTPKTARLLKRLRNVGELRPAGQRTVHKLVDALH